MALNLNWQTDYHRYRRYFTNLTQFYKQKKVRVYTEIVLSLLVTAFFLIFAIKPTLVTIAGLLKEIKDKKMVEEKLTEKVNALALAQQEYRQFENDFGFLDQALPQNPNIPDLIRQLEPLAVKTGVTLKTIRLDKVNLKGEINSQDYSAVEVTLIVSGEYHHLKDFLKLLSSLRRVMAIESLAFGKTEVEKGEQDANWLNLNLKIKTFFLKGKNEGV